MIVSMGKRHLRSLDDDGLEENGPGLAKEVPEQSLQEIFQIGSNREWVQFRVFA